jgi:hypothetical protein
VRTLLGAAVIAAFAAAAPARAQDAGDSDHWDARLTAVSGEVAVHPADGSAEVAGEAGMPLEQGDRIVTSADSTAEISLDGESLMSLTANSDFTLEDTRKNASIFSLTFGSLMAKIQKLGSQSLKVRSPTSVAAVRGTEFGVDVEGEQSHVGVFDEGRVEVQGGEGRAEVLTPNQETSVRRGESPLRAAPLSRFAGRREAMRAHVRRLSLVRRNWKPMSSAQRRGARAGALRRARGRRLNRRVIQRRSQEQRRREQQRRNPNANQRKRPLPRRQAGEGEGGPK